MNYGEYLQLDKILSAQRPLAENEHDENLFIIIHQVYELWFKQLIFEARYLQSQWNKNIAPKPIKRILTILKTAVSQIDILETMTPLSFHSFRDRLENASGFQSEQFRIFELLMGIKRPIDFYHGSAHFMELIKVEIQKPALFDSFLEMLAQKGFKIPREILNRDYSKPYVGNPEVQEILFQIYKDEMPLADVCELLVDLDEGLQEWRYRHIKMVERTIGNKMGTGGSLGTQYLNSTLFKPIFPDLWVIREKF